MMKYEVTNSSDSVISPLETAGGPFGGLGIGESVEVSEAVAKDLGHRYGFLTIKAIVPGAEDELEAVEAPAVEEEPLPEAEVAVEAPIKKETVAEKFTKARKKVFGK